MRRRRIGETDLEASCLCLGGALFGSTLSEGESFALMDAFVEMGGNFLDTAHGYADWVEGFRGLCISEKTIGRWMKSRGNRDSMLVGTKGGWVNFRTRALMSSREELLTQIERSLRELQADCIDIYWLHRDDPKYPVSHFIDLLNEECDLGHIRCFGCSNWTVARIREANAYAAAHDMRGFTANQMWWSLAVPDLDAYGDPTTVGMDDEGMRLHRETGIVAVPYSSQAKGFFNKLDRQGLEGMDGFCRRIFGSRQNVERLPRVKEVAASLDASIAQVVLAWLLAQPFLTIPVIGCRTIEQLRDTVKATQVELSDAQVSYLATGET